MSTQLVEITRELMVNKTKANIGAALKVIRDDRGDAEVSTEEPKSYFIYPRAAAYRAPALFFIVDSMDFRVRQKAGTFVSAIVYLNLHIVVEDRTADLVSIKAERYQAALHEVLNEQAILSADEKVKIYPIVVSATFSDVFVPAPPDPQGMFRKEILLRFEVEHYERL